MAEKCGLATTHLDSLTPSSEDPGMNPAAFSCFALIYDDLCQPIPAPGIVAIETAVANSSRCAVPQQAPRPAGDYSCGCMFWGERGGGHTRQPVGPSVDAAIMTTVLSTNRVDSRSFSSRNCAFRRTHTSTDPIRLLCIRLALPLTLSLPSRFAPGTKLMVAVSPRAPWFAGAFSRDCTFLGCRGGVLTINRQPVGPLVSTAAITTATVINHVDSGSFSSRCCTLRRTHTSADPIRILCIRLALTLTLSRPPGFASCARLMVCVLPCALWVVGDFSCDCMFWDDWGGGLTGQPMGPQVDTANMRTVLSTNHVDSRSFSPRCWAFRRTHPSANPIRLLCIRLALPLTLSLPSGFVPNTKLVVGASLRALGLVGDFSCDCMFWDDRGGGLTGQPMGPQVDTANMRTVLSTNHVDSRSFSSRCWAFRRTHSSADPIRLLCIRLALPLTLSLPSRFAPGTKLMVAVSPRAPWFAGAFSRDCTFLGCRGGVLTINRQPVGPLVSTAAITTATVINHVDSGSFSSRCCTLRRTHTSADPIRILCIRLALTLTLSRPPGFASCARLMVCVLPCALWVVGDFSCDCMFWDDWGGGLTGQPMGPQVDTANMRTVLSTNHVDSRSFSPRCWAFRRTHPSANPIRLLCIRLALPLTLSLPSGFVPNTKLVVGASLRALGLVGDFSCDCMFWDDRGGGLTGQPMGPQVDTANMRTVLSTNHVDSRSFSSRCWAFRRTHSSADPIRLLCIRLALPLTLSLPSGFVPSTKLMVGASPRALGLVKDFSCDCTFWDERGGGLAPVGPRVDTATIRTVLSTNRVDSGSFSSGCCAFRRTHTSADPIRLLCIQLALPLTLPLPLRFAPSARLTVGGTPCALWLVGGFSCDCMFWENSGGGLTTQPVGTATMTTVTSTNRVDLESFSSRCWTFRRTHTSADPIRVLCTRLALPLTLSLTSRLAPRARLTVDVPTRAFWLAGIFLRRKKRCAGVVGTRTDWVLKGEEGGMTTPLLQYVARFDGGGEIFGFGGGGYKESWSWCSLFVEYPSLFVATSGEKPALRFRPRAVVAGRGVVAVCTRISSRECVYDK